MNIFFSKVGKNLDKYSQVYNEFLLTGHFNAEESEPVLAQFRSRHRRCSVRKSVLGNFAKFIGKHLCKNLILIKLQA